MPLSTVTERMRRAALLMRAMAARLVASTGSGVELGDHDVAGLTIDEREDAVLVGSEDGVAFQVADAGPVLGTGRSFGDGTLAG